MTMVAAESAMEAGVLGELSSIFGDLLDALPREALLLDDAFEPGLTPGTRSEPAASAASGFSGSAFR